MKKLLFVVTLFLALQSCVDDNTKKVSQNLKYCESILPYDGGFFVANFGTEVLNPLNNEGKGYIAYVKGDSVNIVVSPNGYLDAPKGMAIKDSYLFVADVNEVLIFDINNFNNAPEKITFPIDDLFVNDIVIVGDMMYVTVTNTGRVYAFGIKDPSKITNDMMFPFAEIPGANGIVEHDGKLYIASYPADGLVREENVIYEVEYTTDEVQVYSVIDEAGMYDGLAFSEDGKRLYFSSWSNGGELGYIDMGSRKVNKLLLESPIVGPADFSIVDNYLVIPDLVGSKVVFMPIK